MHGNHIALAWIFKTWDAEGKAIDINLIDSAGHTALMHCCIRSYTTGRLGSAAKLDETKDDRFKCCSLLLGRN